MSNIYTIEQDIKDLLEENLPAKDFLDKLCHIFIDNGYIEKFLEKNYYSGNDNKLIQLIKDNRDLIEETFPKGYFFEDLLDLEDFVRQNLSL